MSESAGRRMPGVGITRTSALSRRARLTLFAVSLGSAAAAPPSSESVTKTLYAREVEAGAIEVDGRLDEPAWRRAPVGDAFVERVPTPGAVPPVATEVRVLIDEGAVYVGVTAHLLPGESPRALELVRDSFGIFSDDAISLKIDVRHDTRTTLGFATNPAGTQLDYVAVENGSGFRREFDAIWRVETRVEPDRWIAEFELPKVALGLPETGPDEVRVVGLNVTRDHNARLATYDWSPVPPEFGPTSALFYGDLLGLEPLGGGRPLSLIPYALGAWESAADPQLQGRLGGDVRLRLADDVWGELTILTDFAQVDLDDPVVNLDRFPLFFPERRPFFLSGLEFFELGASGSAQLYFSRRIGLDERGETIPLLTGAKTYGTAGALRFGALGALTDATPGRPGQTFSVLRLRQNFGERGHLGAIGTLRTDVGFLGDRDPAPDPRLSVGLDGAVRGFGRRLELTGFGALTAAPEGDAPEGMAGQATVAWRGYLLQPRASVLVVSPDFEPAVGFVRRPGQVTPSVFLAWITRTTELGLQQITVETGGSVVRSWADGSVLTQSATGELDVLLRSGFGFNVFAEAKEDVVTEATEVAGFEVAPGRYRGAFLLLDIRTPSGRNPSGNLTYTRNTAFFGGVANTVAGAFEARLGKHARLGASAELALLDFPGRGERTTLTVNGGATWTPSTQVQLDLIGQTNTLETRATLLARLRWRYLPGSDLFVVYRDDIFWEARADAEAKRSLTVKAAYRFDALL